MDVLSASCKEEERSIKLFDSRNGEDKLQAVLTMLHVSNMSGPLDTSVLLVDDEGVLENHGGWGVFVCLAELDDERLSSDVAVGGEGSQPTRSTVV